MIIHAHRQYQPTFTGTVHEYIVNELRQTDHGRGAIESLEDNIGAQHAAFARLVEILIKQKVILLSDLSDILANGHKIQEQVDL